MQLPWIAKWESLSVLGCQLAAESKLLGFDPETMEILPVAINPAWGESQGPHFSIISLPGIGTADCDGKPDPFYVISGKKDDGTIIEEKYLTQEVRTKAQKIEGKAYTLDIEKQEINFLFGRACNDDFTNGPVMVVASNEGMRTILN